MAKGRSSFFRGVSDDKAPLWWAGRIIREPVKPKVAVNDQRHRKGRCVTGGLFWMHDARVLNGIS